MEELGQQRRGLGGIHYTSFLVWQLEVCDVRLACMRWRVRVSRISLMIMVCLMAFCMLSYHMMRLSRLIVDCRRSTTAQCQSKHSHTRCQMDDMLTSLQWAQHCFPGWGSMYVKARCFARQCRNIPASRQNMLKARALSGRSSLGRMRPSESSVFLSAASEPMRLDCRSLSSRSVAKFLESESAEACNTA